MVCLMHSPISLDNIYSQAKAAGPIACRLHHRLTTKLWYIKDLLLTHTELAGRRLGGCTTRSGFLFTDLGDR